MSEKACILELGGAMQQSPESEPGLRLLRDSPQGSAEVSWVSAQSSESEPGLRLLRDSPQGSAEVSWVSAQSSESEPGLRLLRDSPQGSAEVSSFVGSMRRVQRASLACVCCETARRAALR
jgi:hypothetical protein